MSRAKRSTLSAVVSFDLSREIVTSDDQLVAYKTQEDPGYPPEIPSTVTMECSTTVHTTLKLIADGVYNDMASRYPNPDAPRTSPRSPRSDPAKDAAKDPAAAAAAAPSTTFATFTRNIPLTTSVNGAPILSPLHFSLALTKSEAVSSTTISFTSTPQPSTAVNHITVKGHLEFTPAEHDSTLVTMIASLETTAGSHDDADSPRSAYDSTGRKNSLSTSFNSLTSLSNTIVPGSSRSKPSRLRKITPTSPPTPLEAPQILTTLLSLLPALHATHARYAPIDRAMYDEFERRVDDAVLVTEQVRV